MKTVACMLLVGVALFLGHCWGKGDIRAVEKEKVVTKVKVDTLVKYYPMPYLVYMTGDTIHVTDTVLMVEAVEYKDTNYSIKITGYRPKVEYVEVYPKTITKERVVYKDKKWGIGVTAGYGISKDGLSPGVMVGISYRIY